MRALLTLIIAGVVISVLAPAAPPAQAATPAPAFVAQGYVADVAEVKFPHLAATGGTVHLAANINRRDATYWSKTDTDAAFGAPTRLGPAEEHPDYSTTSITAGPNGALAYVWVNQPSRTIFLRTKADGQPWSATRTVASGLTFGVFPEVAWASDGALVVTWRTPDNPFVFRRSTDGGTTWGAITPISGTGFTLPAIAAGPDGQVAIAFTQGAVGFLQVFVTWWDGRGFVPAQRVSSATGDFADPTVSYGPDGRLYVAWRGVADGGSQAGVFYSARQDDGSWPVAHLAGGTAAGKATIVADAVGNLDMIWTAAPNGPFQVWYSVKPAGGAWSAPVAAPDVGGALFNASAAISVGADGALSANVASEVFSGAAVRIRHYRFSSGLQAIPPPTATPVLAYGAATTAATTIPVTFAQVAGAPAEVRARWGDAPTDADAWQPFGPLTLPLPSGASGASCTRLALFTQLRAANGVTGEPSTATISLDQAVQASLTARGAGAPGYTHVPTIALEVDARADCSGIAAAQLVGSDQPIAPFAPTFSLAAPVAATEGLAQTVGVTLTDTLGNTRLVTASVVYDATPPDFTAGGPLELTPDPHASVLTTVRLPIGSYTDASSDRPWALQVSVVRAGAAPTSEAPTWVTLPLAGEAGPALVAELSLGQFFAYDQIVPGDYTYTARVLDQAGNPAATTVVATLTLDRITFVTLRLPLIAR